MNKLRILPLIILAAITLTACSVQGSTIGSVPNNAGNTPNITIEVGAYGFNTAVITDRQTGERTEYTEREVLQSSTHPWWKTLIGFNVRIHAEDIFRNYQLTKDGRVYHLVANNTLKTYTEQNGFDIEVTMTKQKVYGGNCC